MRSIPLEQIKRRIEVENPWWDTAKINEPYLGYKRRAYFTLLFPLIKETSVRRAVLLMGPRRVGKTVIIHHAIQQLIEDGVNPKHICYISVDHPIYTGLSLDELVGLFCEAAGLDAKKDKLFVFFDEIQYLKQWEVHLKLLVDDHPNAKFIASGSAAAALRMKSHESGAGRFTDFILPPLTFYEFLDLLGEDSFTSGEALLGNEAIDIDKLNILFLDYINYGGYPEAIFSETIRSDPGRYIKSDIIDRVLLRDLPSLYGVSDIRELNSLFTYLAYNTGQEISLDGLAKKSGVAKNTIKKYIEYLEAAFLIKVVHRIDRDAKHFRRIVNFKVYLTNPSMWTALFESVGTDDEAIGSLVETAIFAQLFHAEVETYYARWSKGEVDMVVRIGETLITTEIKWSDRFVNNPAELKSLIEFCKKNKITNAVVTSRTQDKEIILGGTELRFFPSARACLATGQVILLGKSLLSALNTWASKGHKKENQ